MSERTETRLDFASLFRLICQADIGKAGPRFTLIHIAYCAAFSADFRCSRSYAQIGHASGCDVSAVKHHIAWLEQQGYIVVTRKAHGREYTLNLSRILGEAAQRQQASNTRSRSPWELPRPVSAASLPREATLVGGEPGELPASVPDPPESPSEEAAGEPDTRIGDYTLSGYINYLRSSWPDHAIWGQDGYEAMLRADIAECVRLCGTPRRLVDLLGMVKRQKKLWQNVNDSNRLGKYLASCIPGWLGKFQEQLEMLAAQPEDNELVEYENEEEVPA